MPEEKTGFAGLMLKLDGVKGYIAFIFFCLAFVGGQIKSRADQATSNALLRADMANYEEQRKLDADAAAEALNLRFETYDTVINQKLTGIKDQVTRDRSYAESVERQLIKLDGDLSSLLISTHEGHDTSNRLVAGKVAQVQHDVAALKQGMRSNADSLMSMKAVMTDIRTWIAVASMPDSIPEKKGLLKKLLSPIPGL